MNKLDIRSTYRRYVQKLGRRHSHGRAMEVAIGGEFEAFGIVEREILIQYGLQPDGYVIDVGCGSGRLAKPLSEYLRGAYLGIDIVPDLVAYAKQLVKRDDWRFEIADGLEIPERTGRADIVCFFSVFTHLLHEHPFAYLKDAPRVLQPGGCIVFSSLGFAMSNYLAVLESNVSDIDGQHHLNMFFGRDAIVPPGRTHLGSRSWRFTTATSRMYAAEPGYSTMAR